MNMTLPYGEISETGGAPDRFRWISWPLMLFGLFLPLTMLAVVQREYVVGAFLAYINILLMCWTMLHLLRKDPLLGLLSVVSLPFLITAWSASGLYYALFDLHCGYTTLHTFYHGLEGFTRVQAAVLVFLIGYIPLLLGLFHWIPPGPPARPVSPVRLVLLITIICVLLIGVYDASKILFPAKQKDGIVWWTAGLFNYCVGLYLIIGALSRYTSVFIKAFLAVFLAAHMLFCAVGNARLLGLLPVFFYFFGYLFLSGVSQKRKLTTLGILAALFPMYVVFGNTTRDVLGSVGWRNFGYRLQVLLEGPADSKTSRGFFTSTMDRLFMTGGHNIITRTPEQVEYYDFDLFRYGKEMAASLLPGILYFKPDFRTNWHLLRYGFNIGPTSVEISLVGHFWMMGGWDVVFIGGIATGILHGCVVQLVRRARLQSWIKSTVYVSIIGTAMFDTFGSDFIGLFRSLIWRWMLALLVYHAIRFIVSDRLEGWEEDAALQPDLLTRPPLAYAS